MPSAEPDRAKEVYREDIPAALIAAVLAASAFLPWYRGEGNLDISVTAFSSGNWGPIIFFLGLGSFLLIVLRRAGLALSLPFEEALLHEFAGWLALAGGVIKSRYRPGAGLLRLSWGIWVGLGAAFLLAFLAGRMAPHAPLVRRRKWYRAKGGVLGTLFLLAMIAGAAVFGTINSSAPLGSGLDLGDRRTIVSGRLPDCAGDFPLPPIVKPIQGVEGVSCQAHLQSERTAPEVVKAMKDTLVGAGYAVTEIESPGTQTLTVTQPACATVVVVGAQPGEAGSIAVVAFGVCSTPTPTPGS